MKIRHVFEWMLPFACVASFGCATADPERDATATPEHHAQETPGLDEGGTNSEDEPVAIGLAGEYSIEPSTFRAEPSGCRIGGGPPPWTWDLSDPGQDTWTLTERVLVDGEVREQAYVCSSEGATFSCVGKAGFDYGAIGQDADVSLEVRYDGSWEGSDALFAEFELTFSCEGSACAEVAAQWTVTGFPCTNEGTLSGVRQ
jgi:hypothetical protein